jgi:hypothetical protein
LNSDVGESYVVFGRAQPFPAVFKLSSLLTRNGGDGSRGFVVHGVDRDDRSGVSLSAANLNGDSVDDLIIDAPNAGSEVSAGQV